MNAEEKKRKLIEYAYRKFKQYKLKNWHIRFTNHIGNTYADCCHKDKSIHFRMPWVDSINISGLKRVFLHELAHALVDSSHGHDRVWQDMCAKLGIPNETRCGNETLKPKYAKKKATRKQRYWRAYCPSCGWHSMSYYTRRHRGSCPKCSPNVFNADFLLEWKEDTKYHRVS